MKSQRILISLVILTTLLAPTMGLTQAQGPGPQEAVTSQAFTGNAFTYQGFLRDGGNPANGEHDFRFILYDALTGGNQVGGIVIKDNVTVTNGLFSVALDFGSAFDGYGRWLEVGVRPGSSTGSYAILDPRQELTPAPFALYAAHTGQHGHFGEIWSGSTSSAGLLLSNNSTTYGSSALRAVAPSNSGTTYGVYARTDSPQGYGGYFYNAAVGGTALFAEGAVKSTADTEITFSPFDIRAWSGGVSAIPNDQGYVYFQASTTGAQEVLLPVTLPARVFGVPQKLRSIKVCYQLDNFSSYIDKTQAYYRSDSDVLTTMFLDDTDRQNTWWTCYTYDDPTPNLIQGAVIVRFWLNYAGTGNAHEIVIGNISLTLTEN